MSTDIRQRLLVQNTLSLKDAYSIAVTMDDARRDNQIFCHSSMQSVAPPIVSAVNDDIESIIESGNQVVSAVSKRACYHCGSSKMHDFKKCNAASLTCYHCGEKGHISRACLRRKQSSSAPQTFKKAVKTRRENSAAVNNLDWVYSLQTGGSDRDSNCINGITFSQVKGNLYKTLLDTGSSKCFVNQSISEFFGVKTYPLAFEVDMAQASNKFEVTQFCKVDVKLFGRVYEDVTLFVMKHLCVDIILGRDFLNLHKRVVFQFDGPKDELIVPGVGYCAVLAANIKSPSLFSSLRSGWKPITTKSRRFNSHDLSFIKSTVERWKEEKTVRLCRSPWRAQCVVVKRDGKPQRLAIDYSQTINLYTEKDGFPIPLIEDIVNKLAVFKFFASFDLKKAYHQVPICESDKSFTAFEAAGELLEFNVIPFGVTNGGPVFQRVMSEIIKEERLVDTVVYFDNIVIGAHSLTDLEIKSAKFKNSIKVRGMTLNETKTVFGVQELNILGFCVGGNMIRPDPERLKPLMELPPPSSGKSLKRVLGLFAYYAKWVPQFSDYIRKLKSVKKFPLGSEELRDFELLKKLIAKAALQAIDETLPFTVECDASDVAISATLNQGGRPVAFMSRSLSGAELMYPSIEKEATAIIESVRKWRHLLLRQHFVLVTDQRSVAFMLDARKRTKIKNAKIMCWRLELASFSYSVRYRPGKLNVGPDALTRVTCATVSDSDSKLLELHQELCCPGITRFWSFVRSKDLPYSLDDIKRCCKNCQTCAELKPKFFVPDKNCLIKSTQPMERLSLDFKGPLPSSSRNRYFLSVIDEYSRYPFCFPCTDTSSTTVIQCLDNLFSLFGTCNYVHTDRGSGFTSKMLKEYLLEKGIASSQTTPYNPQGNGQCERYNGVLWKSIRCALRSRQLPIEKWEVVVPTVLNSIRSLLCTTTGDTPHARFLSFTRRSYYGKSLPAWMTKPGTVLLRKFVRTSKNDDLVQRVKLVEANPTYARIQYPDGRMSNVSLKDLARYPENEYRCSDENGVSNNGSRDRNLHERYPEEGDRNGHERYPEDGQFDRNGHERFPEEGRFDHNGHEQFPEEGNRCPDDGAPFSDVVSENAGRLMSNDQSCVNGGGGISGVAEGNAVPRRSGRLNRGVPPARLEYS